MVAEVFVKAGQDHSFNFELIRILPGLSWLSIFWHWTPRQFDFGVRFIGARSVLA